MGTFITGYKTYITAVAAGLTVIGQLLGILTEEQSRSLLEGLGILLAVFIRMGVATGIAVAATNLAVATGTISTSHAKEVSVANPAPAPPLPTMTKEM